MGPSGAGKSTLLQICGLLDRADGLIKIDGQECSNMFDHSRTLIRRKKLWICISISPSSQ